MPAPPRSSPSELAAGWSSLSRESCGCLTALAFALFADQTALILVLGATFQFFGMLTNTTLAAWSPELYPTRIRTLGTSIVNGIGNIGGAIMPFAAVALFAAYGFAGVFGMVAVMYAILVIASRFAPETRGRTLEEVDEARLVVDLRRRHRGLESIDHTPAHTVVNRVEGSTAWTH